MAQDAPSAIIISDGGLPAMLAASIEAERAISTDSTAGAGGGGAASIMAWPGSPTLAATQAAAAASQARFHRLTLAETPRLCAPDLNPSPGLLDSLALLAALELARSTACTRIVWPAHQHADDDSLPAHLDRIGATIDRALLMSRLSLLDPDSPDVTIETPLVDLTDRQLADLVVDLDAPAYLCWWWRRAAEPAAEALAAPERHAWLTALREAGWVQSEPAVKTTPQQAGTPTQA